LTRCRNRARMPQAAEPLAGELGQRHSAGES
jgi:hypothetical protein